MVKFRMKDKRDRNARLIKFKREHPDYTQDAIAKVFHISRPRVTRILKAHNNKQEVV